MYYHNIRKLQIVSNNKLSLEKGKKSTNTILLKSILYPLIHTNKLRIRKYYVLWLIKYYQLVYIGIVSYSGIINYPVEEFHYLFAIRMINCSLEYKYSYPLLKHDESCLKKSW